MLKCILCISVTTGVENRSVILVAYVRNYAQLVTVGLILHPFEPLGFILLTFSKCRSSICVHSWHSMYVCMCVYIYAYIHVYICKRRQQVFKRWCQKGKPLSRDGRMLNLFSSFPSTGLKCCCGRRLSLWKKKFTTFTIGCFLAIVTQNNVKKLIGNIALII